MTNRVKKAIIAIVVVLALAVAGSVTYLTVVKKSCMSMTNVVMEYARQLNFDDTADVVVPKMFRGLVDSTMTEEEKEEYDVKKMVKSEIASMVEEEGLSSILTEKVTDACTDLVIDDIVKDADYEVIDAKPGFTSCTVTVRTSNIDYEKLLAGLPTAIKADISDPSSSLWSNAGSVVSKVYAMITGQTTEDDETFTDTVTDAIKNYYYDKKDSAEAKEYTGDITYGIVDGKWTITNIDEQLISAYYGIPVEKLNLNLSDYYGAGKQQTAGEEAAESASTEVTTAQ